MGFVARLECFDRDPNAAACLTGPPPARALGRS